jgi:uncharacterized paraquat-inducible protein A
MNGEKTREYTRLKTITCPSCGILSMLASKHGTCPRCRYDPRVEFYEEDEEE